MMAFIVIVWLGFQGLAICILGGLLSMGFNSGDAIAVAVDTVAIGSLISRAMYRKTYVIKTITQVTPHETSRYLSNLTESKEPYKTLDYLES